MNLSSNQRFWVQFEKNDTRCVESHISGQQVTYTKLKPTWPHPHTTRLDIMQCAGERNAQVCAAVGVKQAAISCSSVIVWAQDVINKSGRGGR